ncbi:unnamed protein product [Closterium sp. NIES-53]
MASLCVLAFDYEGRLIQFDTWLDDLRLYLLSDSRDSVLLFDHTSGAAPAPPATADSATRSQTAHALYDAIVARYSSPAIAALGRLLLPYLFPELSAFAIVEDLVSHLRTSDASYRAALSQSSLPRTRPRSLDPTDLTVDLLEQHLVAAETNIVADVGAASTSGKRRSSKSKGGTGGGGGSGGGGGGSGGSGGAGGGGGSGGSGGGSGGSGSGGGGSGGSGSGGSGSSGSSGNGGGRTGAQRGGSVGGQW